jgi:hypothetical protein
MFAPSTIRPACSWLALLRVIWQDSEPDQHVAGQEQVRLADRLPALEASIRCSRRRGDRRHVEAVRGTAARGESPTRSRRRGAGLAPPADTSQIARAPPRSAPLPAELLQHE